MKAYKVTLLVIDHDKLGANAITDNIESVRYPNRCISPRVMEIEEKDIGEWTDAHPLNQTATKKTAYADVFAHIFGDLFHGRPDPQEAIDRLRKEIQQTPHRFSGKLPEMDEWACRFCELGRLHDVHKEKT